MSNQRKYYQKNNWPSLVKFENREIWADLENRSKVVHSENFPIWRPASGHRDHVTHHVTSHVTHWGQWKYASRSWHAVGNHRRQLKLMYRSKISGRGPKNCSGSKFQCRPRPAYSIVLDLQLLSYVCLELHCFSSNELWCFFVFTQLTCILYFSVHRCQPVQLRSWTVRNVCLLVTHRVWCAVLVANCRSLISSRYKSHVMLVAKMTKRRKM